jgi:hypothetical protein
MSWRALFLLTVGVMPFLTTSLLWLWHPSDTLAVYGIVPSALLLVMGVVSYYLASLGDVFHPTERPRARL